MPAHGKADIVILVKGRLPWHPHYDGRKKCDRESKQPQQLIVETIISGDTALAKRRCQLCGDFHERLGSVCDESDFDGSDYRAMNYGGAEVEDEDSEEDRTY